MPVCKKPSNWGVKLKPETGYVNIAANSLAELERLEGDDEMAASCGLKLTVLQ